jgi:predicted esterase
VHDAFDYLYEVIEEQGPFDGIIGFSQGATIACAFMLNHICRNPLDPPFALFRYAVFFSGAGIMDVEGITCLEGTSTHPLIDIPSLHVCGEADKMYKDSLTLYKICNSENAELIPHKLGHTVPKDSRTVDLIVKAIGRLQHKAMVI